MIRFLTVEEVKEIHRQMIDRIGGSHGIRDLGALESAVAQPAMTFGGEDLYGTLEEKAATLAFSLVCNHPFVDGNKRVGHATMELFLRLNGLRIECPVDEQEKTILDLAAGRLEREAFASWVSDRVTNDLRSDL